ncbi:hypothetical protein BHE74_00008942 [Ensete ventricosum]|nr:hypothetical protein GW17_00016751 [Ensete ventricosum]RWW82591.1 hypothetical protein BHE74_00008942 [Ensete ventricosum]RZS18903.1 hypothetical protein BHM03_00051228 [Ensete ventricosum]
MEQGLQFRPVSPGTNGTYWSARLPVRRPPATGGTIKNRPSTVDFGRRQSIEGEKGKKKKKKKRKRRKKKRRRRKPSAVLARVLPARRHQASALARFFSRTSPRSGRKDRGNVAPFLLFF